MSEETQEFVEEVADLSNSPDDELEQDQPVDEEDGEQEPDEEEDEIDVGDKKLRVPKSIAETLKSERLMHADYTRKTQEVAEQRKAFETQQAQHAEQVKAHEANLREVAAVLSLDETVEQYKKIDWEALSDADPIEAQKHYMKFQQLMQARDSAVQRLNAQQQQQALEAQQSKAKQLEQSFAVVSRDIKGWNLDIANKVFSYGESHGYTADELRQNASDPRFIKLLHGNYVQSELTKKAATKAETKPVVKPATVVGNNASPVKKDPKDMTDKEFNAMRKAQIKQRR